MTRDVGQAEAGHPAESTQLHSQQLLRQIPVVAVAVIQQLDG